MSTASISELKAKLSAYLREVRLGGEVQVVERGKPIARLVPLPSESATENVRHGQQRERLIASGILRPGTGIDQSLRPIPVSVELSQSLEDERADRL